MSIKSRLSALERRVQRISRPANHRREFALLLQCPETRAQAMQELDEWRGAIRAKLGFGGMSDAEIMQGIIWKEG